MKEQYMVFILEGEDWVQDSVPLDSYEQAEMFAAHYKAGIHYIICKILKQT